ncbi:MAG: ribosomal protein L7/L12 [Anaerolineae bacterium]|nr:ribosomal protein L7/L12 [Anaerolineae bacterium]
MSDNQSRFDVLLVKPGSDRVGFMKVIMELTSGGLKQSKDLMDGAPSFVLRDLDTVHLLRNAGLKRSI